jgi:hypothetical protein
MLAVGGFAASDHPWLNLSPVGGDASRKGRNGQVKK